VIEDVFDVYSMVYSEEMNELFGGGVGCVLHWKVAAVSDIDCTCQT